MLVEIRYLAMRSNAGAEASAQSVVARLQVARLLPVVAVVARGPAVVAIVAGLPWQTPTWWILAGAPMTIVLFLVFGTPLELARRRSEWWPRMETEDQRPVLQTFILLGVALLIVPGAVAATLLVELDLELSVALALLAAYLVWQGTRTRVQHWPTQ